MELYYGYLFRFSLLILAVIIVIYVIRSIVGPALADRILAVNAIGTCTILAIAILSLTMQEAYLLDVCLVYAMLSFLAIIVLSAFVTREKIELDETGGAGWTEEEKEILTQATELADGSFIDPLFEVVEETEEDQGDGLKEKEEA